MCTEGVKADMRFKDRTEAGEALARELIQRKFDDPVVLALPRGGLPVAAPIARALDAPLGLVMVKKIGMPGHEEYAIGAIVDGAKPHLVINEGVLASGRVTRDDIDKIAETKLKEIERRKKEYGISDMPDLKGRTAIIVDDGVATGATAKAAIDAVKAQGPARTILAIPVAPKQSVTELGRKVDAVVCLSQPEFFYAVGAHYVEFGQVSDAQVKDMMRKFNPS
jgi:putative phosphoribosyl transferase